MLIDDDVMDSIDTSLRNWKSTFNPVLEDLNEVVLWALITVIRHTGVRLTEALNLNSDCMNRDLMNKHLMEIVSPKNETERFIPVNRDVSVAIDYLCKATEELRSELKTDKLFYYFQKINKKHTPLTQYEARRWLGKYIKRFNIGDSNGNLAFLTYNNFRHQIGTELLNNGMSPFEVKEYLGHESMHSTRLYAKVRNDRLTKEYKKLGFVGVVENSTEDIVDEDGNKLDSEKRLMAQLPDGVCAKPIGKKVIDCRKPNACLFCPKFITTPEFLDIHKNHLERIKEDKERYLAEDLMGSEYHLFETEKALADIISRLSALQEGGTLNGDK
ncbi:tyrosine-type recombinase/integrase [Aquibacillus salsiterrae]|uniref:Site-specific integrase n=1 Tax=Aquibacillus salsiterrae TaxID=2950439 RepID=A0A9X3WHX5_9BACI|nr:site-specific integrase [Aquibacillus salsiterrae]MDC3417709.1 site-specific integrase [Aquibacillus salsiterrae]